jgi:hypothetical protein
MFRSSVLPAPWTNLSLQSSDRLLLDEYNHTDAIIEEICELTL